MGPIKIYTGTLASGVSQTGAIPFKDSYKKMFLQVPTLSTTGALSFKGSVDNTTFYTIYTNVNSSTSASFEYKVVSGVGTSGGLVDISEFSVPYLKIVCTENVNNGAYFKVICHN